MKTRDRIIATVVDAFNATGYHTHSLADLAQICNMSRGNLAYHYKSKDDILYDISIRMIKDIQRYQKRRVDFPAFFNLSLDIRTCRSLQERYPFIFRDMSVLEHDSIKSILANWSKEVIKRNLQTFAYGIEIGNVKEEPHDGLYYMLSVNAWLITYYWVAQQAVRAVGRENPEKMVWSTIYPHFTEKGMLAFNEYFGDKFLTQPGVSIKNYIELQHLI